MAPSQKSGNARNSLDSACMSWRVTMIIKIREIPMYNVVLFYQVHHGKNPDTLLKQATLRVQEFRIYLIN